VNSWKWRGNSWNATEDVPYRRVLKLVKAESIGNLFRLVSRVCQFGKFVPNPLLLPVDPATEVLSAAEFIAEETRLPAPSPL